MNDNNPNIDDVFGHGYRRSRDGGRIPRTWKAAIILMGLFVLGPLLVLPFFLYTECRIEVPYQHVAVLIRKVGKDLPNGEEIAPDASYKGVQRELLPEGRYFYNPFLWDWEVVPYVEIPRGKLGVRIRLYGDDLPPGDIIAWKENQKGIVPEILTPGRYELNGRVEGSNPRRYDSYAEIIELFDPVTVPAGFKGVVSNLSAPMPEEPNVLIVTEPGKRGVQPRALDPGTYYVNPYVERIDLVDCRSQRFDLSSEAAGVMGFPSKDGFWVVLDGAVEFRVKPEEAARVFVTYKETSAGATIDEEIVRKIILPNARSFCRLRGSGQSGREFISGETRAKFQEDFQKELAEKCDAQGIEVIQALITRIRPPEKIADPVRKREFAVQEAKRYEQEIQQQLSEQRLAIQKELVKQKQAIVSAEQEVIRVVTQATREKEVALIEANQRLKVAEFELKAAEDEAAAVIALGKAKADVIEFDNAAAAAGWKRSVDAFGGDGNEFARWTLLNRLAPAFKKMMVNTADSPLTDIFREFSRSGELPTTFPGPHTERGPGSNAGEVSLPRLFLPPRDDAPDSKEPPPAETTAPPTSPAEPEPKPEPEPPTVEPEPAEPEPAEAGPAPAEAAPETPKTAPSDASPPAPAEESSRTDADAKEAPSEETAEAEDSSAEEPVQTDP